MLKYFNCLLTYIGFYSWKQVLAMHHNFLSAVEPRKKSWDDWELIQKWHNVQLKALKPLPVDEHNNMMEKSKKDPNKEVVCGVEVGTIKSSHLCVKFQFFLHVNHFDIE